jgi:hypothetical protein
VSARSLSRLTHASCVFPALASRFSRAPLCLLYVPFAEFRRAGCRCVCRRPSHLAWCLRRSLWLLDHRCPPVDGEAPTALPAPPPLRFVRAHEPRRCQLQSRELGYQLCTNAYACALTPAAVLRRVALPVRKLCIAMLRHVPRAELVHADAKPSSRFRTRQRSGFIKTGSEQLLQENCRKRASTPRLFCAAPGTTRQRRANSSIRSTRRTATTTALIAASTRFLSVRRRALEKRSVLYMTRLGLP